MTRERWARLLFLVAAGLPLLIVGSQWLKNSAGASEIIELHGRMADDGGWTPGDIVTSPGRPLRLRLVADDVVHGFGIGRSEFPAVDMKPGQPVEAVIEFTQPGTYTFYCTRWCGKNHWRMRGTIEVRARADPPARDENGAALQPHVAASLDLDAPHPAAVLPDQVPSAARAESLHAAVPSRYAGVEYYRTHSPADAWRALRAERSLAPLADGDVWDVVASLWQSQAAPPSLEKGTRLYAANCAACHGERGRGDGVMAPRPFGEAQPEMTHGIKAPANFTDQRSMLGVSPALLYGKIQRGGMGTGMPNWGPILTDDQTWALVQYLWRFQFPVSRAISPDPRAIAPAGGSVTGPQ